MWDEWWIHFRFILPLVWIAVAVVGDNWPYGGEEE